MVSAFMGVACGCSRKQDLTVGSESPIFVSLNNDVRKYASEGYFSPILVPLFAVAVVRLILRRIRKVKMDVCQFWCSNGSLREKKNRNKENPFGKRERKDRGGAVKRDETQRGLSIYINEASQTRRRVFFSHDWTLFTKTSQSRERKACSSWTLTFERKVENSATVCRLPLSGSLVSCTPFYYCPSSRCIDIVRHAPCCSH